MSRPDANTFAQAASQISSWRKPLLISHVKPDGDALGSLVAMRSLLRSRDVAATALLFDELPDRYALFQQYGKMPVLGRELTEADLSDFDGVLVLDTCAYSQLNPIADWLRSSRVPKLAVDHHVTRDELADHYLIDESAAATCLILREWAQALDWPITAEAREALFTGMAMDTGWFRHSNTDDRVLSVVADLVVRGVRPHELYQQLFQRETSARVRLLGAALGTLELLAGERLGVMTLAAEDIAVCGATTADTEDIVNEPLRIWSVDVSVLLVQDTGGIIRASFRSKPPGESKTAAPTAAPTEPRASASPLPTKGGLRGVDVSQVAQAFGGGGHTRAAGARISGTLSEVRKMIVDHIQRELPN